MLEIQFNKYTFISLKIYTYAYSSKSGNKVKKVNIGTKNS